MEEESGKEQGWEFALWFFVRIARFFDKKEQETLSFFVKE